ncbi:hypothetical protein MHBO_004394, partial [Bonamia ostreae]
FECISVMFGGKEGYANWRATLIGGNYDEFDFAAPEQVLSPWHDLGIEIAPDEFSDDFNQKFRHIRMVVTTPKGFAVTKFIKTFSF